MSAKSTTRWLAIALLSVALSIANGQTVLSDPDAYRTAKIRATDIFLDSSQTTADRLEALTMLGYPEDETFAELLRVGTDLAEDDEIRLVALKRYLYDDKYLDAVYAIISNPDEGEMLAAGLIEDVSRRTTFRHPAEIRQRMQREFRIRLDDDRDAVRLAAYRALVPTHDTLAIDNLVEGLRGASELRIPLADAIELLDVDGSTKHIVTLRPFLENPDPAVQARAARALGVDSASRDAIVRLAQDAEAPMDVRVNALRSLSREDEQFMSYATRLMSNRDESADIRYSAMKQCMGRLNYHHVDAKSQVTFAKAVRQLSLEPGLVTNDGLNVTAEAKKLIPHLRKTFPVIRRYFDNR